MSDVAPSLDTRLTDAGGPALLDVLFRQPDSPSVPGALDIVDKRHCRSITPCGTIHRVSDRSSELLLSVLDDVEPLMRAAFDAVGGTPEPGSALDHVFLLNGREVVVDYLTHGEPALALDHLVYMIVEPGLASVTPLIAAFSRLEKRWVTPRVPLTTSPSADAR